MALLAACPSTLVQLPPAFCLDGCVNPPINLEVSLSFLALAPDLIEELEGGGGGLLLVPTDDVLLPELEALNATGASWAVGVASRLKY